MISRGISAGSVGDPSQFPKYSGMRRGEVKAVMEYVSEGVSMESVAARNGVSKDKLIDSIKRFSELLSVIKWPKEGLSGILICDEKGIRIGNKMAYAWAFIDYGSRIEIYSTATYDQGWKDVARGYLAYEASKSIRVIISDRLTAYIRASIKLFWPDITLVFWNRPPPKDMPKDFLDPFIVIDDFGDFATCSLGRDRNFPLGSFRCVNEENLASLIKKLAGRAAIIVVNTKKNMSKVAMQICSANLRQVVHFVCGKGYLKAYVERVFKDLDKSLAWFHGFSSLETAKAFIRDYFFSYNWLKRHGSLGVRPAEYMLGEAIGDWFDAFRRALALPKIDIKKALREVGDGKIMACLIIIILPGILIVHTVASCNYVSYS